MQLLQNDTQMNILFCKETKQLLKNIKNNIKTNKIDKNNILISLHNLKAIALLFELDLATKLVFELENYVFDLKPNTLTQNKLYEVLQLYKKIKKQFNKHKKRLKCNLNLNKALRKFNQSLNNKATTTNKIHLALHTKIQSKLKNKKQKHILKILFELIKNSHVHGFGDINKYQNKINIRIFYKNTILIIFYKDNGKGCNSHEFATTKNNKTKNILYGFNIGSDLINKYAKKLKVEILQKHTTKGFGVVFAKKR